MFFVNKVLSMIPISGCGTSKLCMSKVLYIKRKISLPYRVNSNQLVFRWFLFVSMCLLKSNFVITRFDDQMTLLYHLIIGQLKMRQKWTQETIQRCRCVDVLCQIISLATFREISLAIYRHNVNFKLTDASVYKIYPLNLWHKGMSLSHV